MKLVDTHTHLFLEQFDEDRDSVIERAKEAGVKACFLPNIEVNTIERVWETAEAYPNYCFPMFGLHPCSVKDDYKEQLDQLYKCFSDSREIPGVGEIGLDFYWDTTYKNEQIDAFRTQIKWAKELDKPFIIHCRDSFEAIEEVLNEFEGSLHGVFHCFTGDADYGKRMIEKGLFLGIGGIVTFKNAGLDKTVKELPIEKLVLETDSPYLAPSPNRGKRNESSFVQYVAKKLAEIYALEDDEVGRITSRNAEALFKMKIL